MSRVRSLSFLSPSRRRSGGRKAQRGLTLLEIMIVIAILGLLVVIVVPRVVGALSKSEVDLTRVAVNNIANDWYNKWDLASDEPCPQSILELAKAVSANEEDTKDPWGMPYKLMTSCQGELPAGVSTVGVMSFGPDKKEGTPDDIKSWERAKKKQ
jgi:general secretion pathway protein G